MIYAVIICVVIIIFLGIRLYNKQEIDKNELQQYYKELTDAKAEKKLLEDKVNYEHYKLDEYKKDLEAAMSVYQDLTENKLKEIDEQMAEQRQARQNELDETFKQKERSKSLEYETLINEYRSRAETFQQQAEADIAMFEERREQALANMEDEEAKFNSLLEPIKQYEKERQDKLYYTIQLPEEFQEDIEFLLTTVAGKVQHPDIISKLVWTEYVKPYLDDTFKRVEIKDESGIYKLTNINTGKCYIGKSTNVKKRIQDHFKSSIGIRSIADQAVHHEILKTGFWNWSIEVIIYADKDQLNDLEKYYIDFFKSQEFGYNIRAGG